VPESSKSRVSCRYNKSSHKTKLFFPLSYILLYFLHVTHIIAIRGRKYTLYYILHSSTLSTLRRTLPPQRSGSPIRLNRNLTLFIPINQTKSHHQFLFGLSLKHRSSSVHLETIFTDATPQPQKIQIARDGHKALSHRLSLF
jgi:hypothetical protein